MATTIPQALAASRAARLAVRLFVAKSWRGIADTASTAADAVLLLSCAADESLVAIAATTSRPATAAAADAAAIALDVVAATADAVASWFHAHRDI